MGIRKKEQSAFSCYVQEGCRTSCGVSQSIAPELVGWTREELPSCYRIPQPETAEEVDRAIEKRQAEARRYVTAFSLATSLNDAMAAGVT